MKRYIKLPSLLMTVFLLCYSCLSQARPSIVFSCGIPTSLPQWQTLETLYRKAFDTLGYDFSMVYINTKRMLHEHKYYDKYDGICAFTRMPPERLQEYGLILVESPVGDPNTALWRNKSTTAPDSDSPLLQPNTQAGYLRGNNIGKRFIQQFPSVTPVTFIKPNLGMKTLAAGRIDYWVGFAYTADFLAEDLELTDTVEKVAIIRQDFFYPLITEKLLSLKTPLENQLKQAAKNRGG
ncbi:MAG: hypothetical protein VXZ35_00780, partial [Pseudomonadota bacterium]|nr:hypothetical protein [Pseudomonadota bacterium]